MAIQNQIPEHRYYERELGAGLGPSPSLKEHFGYSEPLRRFIQRESFEPQASHLSGKPTFGQVAKSLIGNH